MLDILKELFEYLLLRKRIWIIPIVVVLVLLGLIIVLAEGSALAPLIYTLF